MTDMNEYLQLKSQVLAQLETFEAELKKAQLPLPHVVSPEFHPLDSPAFLPTNELFQVRRQLAGSLGMLSTLVQPPAEALMATSFSHHKTSAISVVTRAGIPEILEKLGPKPVSIETLATKSSTHPIKLLKVMRLLSNNHIFNEGPIEGEFSHNRVSKFLVKPNPIRNFTSFQSWFSLMSSSSLADTLLDEKKGKSLDPKDAALPAALGGFEKLEIDSMFDYLGKYHMDRKIEFGGAMAALGSVGVAGMLSDYPWKDLSTIVDVGGGNGAFLLPLLQAHQHLHGILQDKPDTVPHAETHFKDNYPEAINDQRVEFEAYDFFKPQTRKAQGKDFAYLLRWVIHDFNEDDSIKILKVLADAMDQDSRVLIIDTVIEPAVAGNKESKESGKVSYPLPQSLGNGGYLSLAVDYEMMSCLNATERTLKQFEKIFDAAGFRLEKYYQCRSPHAIIEARKK